MKRTIIIALSVVALVFGVISYATAATSGVTTVNATVANMLELTVVDTSINLGELTPDVDKTAEVELTGKSNKPATLSANVVSGGFTTLDSVFETPKGNLRGGNIKETDTLTAGVTYFVNPDSPVVGTITYSLVQQL